MPGGGGCPWGGRGGMGMPGGGSVIGGMGIRGRLGGGGNGIMVGSVTSSTIRGSLPWSKGQRSPRMQNPFSAIKKALKPLKSTISQQQKHKAWRFSKALWRLSLKQAFHTNTRQGGWTSVEFAPCKQCCMDRHVSFLSMCQISACLIRSGLIKLTIHPSGIPVDLLLPLPAVWKIPSLQKDRVVNINTAGLTPLPEGHAVRLQHHSH